jgi:DNA-directed RNA polymerase specialized sigma24 family protein
MPHDEPNFPTTQWSLLASLVLDSQESRTQAAAKLADLYWPPVFAYFSAQGHAPDYAADLTQAFFADVVLQRRLFERANQDSGRLRSLMLTSLKNFLIDQHRSKARRIEKSHVAIDSVEWRLTEPLRKLEPEVAFNRRWALAVCHEALRRCAAHYAQVAPRNWTAFEAWDLRPAAGMPAPTAEALAQQLAFNSATDLRAAVQTVRKRFRTLVREVVAEQTSPADADNEHAELLAFIS